MPKKEIVGANNAPKKFNPQEHLTDIKGKSYLQVMWRLVWFREEHPTWAIETTAIQIDPKLAIFSASIKDEAGRIIAMGTGTQTPQGFKEYIEKAETKAIGRALALAGYGTQFSEELDDTDSPQIVDSPVGYTKPAPQSVMTDKQLATIQSLALQVGMSKAEIETKIGKPMTHLSSNDASSVIKKLMEKVTAQAKEKAATAQPARDTGMSDGDIKADQILNDYINEADEQDKHIGSINLESLPF